MSNRIKELREARGISQPQLAGLVGTSQPQMDRLEKGQRRLTQDWMQRIARVLKCQPADLLGPQGESPTMGELDSRQKRLLMLAVKQGLRQVGVDPDTPEGMRKALAAYDDAEAEALALASEVA